MKVIDARLSLVPLIRGEGANLLRNQSGLMLAGSFGDEGGNDNAA